VQCTFPGLKSLAGKEDHGIASVLQLLSSLLGKTFKFVVSSLAELGLVDMRLEGDMTVSWMLD